MWVLIAAALFWILVGVVMLRIVRNHCGALPISSQVLTAAALGLGALLLFRPHEDIFGGQDGGAYVNTAARLARMPHLSYTDPLLAQVPPDVRAAFLYYGFERPYLSKYGCGRVKDFDRAICGVWFQPAYPIVASLPARLYGVRAIFCVAPIFGLFTALVLAALARQIWPGVRWVGESAALFYLLNPLAVWHARHPRPEILASFCVLAGAALLIKAWNEKTTGEAVLDTTFGSLCMSVAPFFHIIAWMAVVPAAALVALAILSGRRVFLVYPLIAYVALRAFVWQLVHVNDTYGLLRRMPWLTEHLATQVALLALIVVALVMLSRDAGFLKKWAASLAPHMGLITGAAIVSGYAACWILARLNPPTKEWPPVHYFAYRTDLHAVLNMISRPAGILGLAGLLVMAIHRGNAAAERRAVLWLLAPATMLLGNLYDFFLTRYLMLAIIPLLSLALASLLTLWPSSFNRVARMGRLVPCVVTVLILLHHRVHLLRTVEYRGLSAFLENIAKTIRRENGILLFEYPRLAAPLDLMFGVPTLALHNERDDDYTRQEQAWADIMRRHTNRPAFFITPFQPPRSTLFHFEPTGAPTYEGELLAQKRWDLPTDVRPWSVTLRMYRMKLANGSAPHSTSFPNVYAFDAGNMGLRRFAQVPQKPRQTDGIPLGRGTPIRIPLPSQGIGAPLQSVVAVFLSTSSTEAVHATIETASGSALRLEARPVAPEWFLAIIPGRAVSPLGGKWLVSSEESVFLHDFLLLTSNRCVSVCADLAGPERKRISLRPIYTRWARQDAAVCVPIPEDRNSLLLVFHTAPDELSEPTIVTARSPAITPDYACELPPGRWMWTAWPLQRSAGTPWEWVSFHAKPTFDPQMRSYPPDLITHFGWVCVANVEDE